MRKKAKLDLCRMIYGKVDLGIRIMQNICAAPESWNTSKNLRLKVGGNYVGVATTLVALRDAGIIAERDEGSDVTYSFLGGFVNVYMIYKALYGSMPVSDFEGPMRDALLHMKHGMEMAVVYLP